MLSLVTVNVKELPFPKTHASLDKAISQVIENRLTVREKELIERHLQEVGRDIEVKIDLDGKTLSEVGAFLDWVDGARAIDPNDFPASAGKWQDALRSLLNGSRDMLTALQKITPETIERFEKTKVFSTDDAISLESEGFGSVLPVRYGPLRVPKEAQAQTLKRVFVFFGAVTFIPMLLTVFIAPLTEQLIGNYYKFLPVAVTLVAFSFALWAIAKPFGFIKARVLFPRSGFWISAKGNFLLSTVFGRNPNGTVIWDIAPVEVEKISLHLEENAHRERDFPGW